ncbi:sulfatase-like hydrolase/transferase [Algoriphagus marinus]|uniref:sulfatase-like hydrolase/transferase n=1 Tax=Algoriphagus marinus TaxID=1925762 RepID=UPI00094B9A3F|nr:sulfatase-like hydrolase/transferase [Algoriphagus marinus]
MKPNLIKISFFILLVSFACKAPQEDVNSTITYPDRPNIVWIVAEDLSPQHLGAYGGTGGKTPFLDSLAADGVIYSQAYSTAGVCAPSRAALITGAYQTAVGGHHMRTLGMSANALDAYPPGHKSYSAVIPADMKTYPELLRMAGYYTSNNSKEDYQFRGPVTMWDESSNKAHWRNRKDPTQPFFSIFNFTTSHESQVWMRADEPLLVDPVDVFIPPYYPDDSISRAVMARFITNAMRMDMQVGEVIAQLKEDGLYENTIIFFYGDHGDGMPYAKRELYDRGLKVPLIIKAPFLEKGGQRDELVSFVDFGPTVLSLAGVEVPKSMHGQAFLGKQKADPRKYIYAARDRMDSEYDRVRAVSDGRFKYIRNYMPEKPNYQNIQYRLNNPLMIHLLELNEAGKLDANQARWFAKTKPVEELYDTSIDPYEFNNLVKNSDYASKLTELRAAHEQWLLDYPDLGAMNEQEMVRNWWGGKDTPPVTAVPEIAFNGGKVSINVDMPGASIGYRKSTKDTWSVYVGPFEAVAGDSLYVNTHRIGYEPNGGAMVLE